MGKTIILAIAILCVGVQAVPYSKYGRSCKDINCLSNERCVMAEDPCSSYESTACGRYPTCKKADYAGQSCSTMVCPSGKYCRTENGKPTCVNTVPNIGYDTAGVSTVNGQPSNTGVSSDPRYNSNVNPYANANAPPPEDDHYPGKPSYNSYPPYPTNSGSGRDLGYPPYPSTNRMPQPGQSYPSYPNSNGYNKNYPAGSYPAGSYPNYHQNYPYNNKNGYNYKFRNNASCSQATLLNLTSVLMSAALMWILQRTA